MDTPWQHTTVLLNEAVEALCVQPDKTYVDATFGRGGHSRLILSKLSDQGRLIAFDKDPDAIAEAAQIQDARFAIRHEGFAHLADLSSASVDGVLLDQHGAMVVEGIPDADGDGRSGGAARCDDRRMAPEPFARNRYRCARPLRHPALAPRRPGVDWGVEDF